MWTKDDYATPWPFVFQLQRHFGIFELDPCCQSRTAKATRRYSLRLGQNGLRLPWDGRVFFNPPYSNPAPWARRAYRETRRGRCPLAVGLLPSSCIDTHWFHQYVLPYAEIHFVRGRIAFLDKHGEPATSPRQGNVVATWRADSDRRKPNAYPHVYHTTVFEANCQ